MTNFISGASAAARKKRILSPAAALRVQSSANGLPRPFGYGQARIAGNIIWYGNFTPNFVQSQGGGGGKGGVGGGGGKNGGTGGSYVYSAGVAFGLCEGPIDSVIQAWQNKSALTQPPQSGALKSGLAGVMSAAGFSLFDGGYQQLPWPFLLNLQPSSAQNFRGLAYEADNSLYLGASPELPNMSWELRFALSGAIQETATIPGSPHKVTAAYYDWDYGVVVRFPVPAAAPYQYASDAGQANNLVAQSGLAMSINPGDDVWGNSDSSGVIWDLGASNGTPGQPLTRVGSAPGPGQYSVITGTGSGINWVFNPADAGQPVVGIVAALSPGVYYVQNITADLVAGSAVATNISSTAGAALGARVSAPGYLAEGTLVTFAVGGSAAGNTTAGSPAVGNVSGNFSATAGTPVADSKGAIPPGTTVSSATPPSVTAASAAALSAAGVAFNSTYTVMGAVADNQLINLTGTVGIAVGKTTVLVVVSDGYGGGFYANATVIGLAGTTATLDTHTGFVSDSVGFDFVTQFTGDVEAGSAIILNPSSLAGLSTASVLTDSIGAFASGVGIAAVTVGAITLSANATASVTGDAFSFAAQAILSQPALKTGTGVAVTVRGAPLAQVLSAPAQGQFALSVQAGAFGQYIFNSADTGQSVLIMDGPDANPADVLVDLLTNPYYGMTQFAPARVGDLSTYRNYCLAAGLVVSPTITNQAAANQFLDDLMTATNSELVWSAGKLTAVPYGDTVLTANGAAYSPPASPIYSFTDDDLLENQGTNAASVSAAATGDPVTVTRLDPADQENDIKVEYLDRANVYNPTVVEAKDDAAIALFGVKSAGARQLHLFCNQGAALTSAQLMLGRQQVRRSFSFTVDRKYILLDPMDIVAITDANAGLVGQWVRIKEISENDDRSLSIVAEEYLEGSGTTARYGHQSPGGYVANYNIVAPNALQPVFFDAPVQIGNVLAMETIVATNGAGPSWGGCDIWISSDDVNFKYAGTLWGGTTMGTLTASFASGSDPDTAHTLAVDLTASKGVLSGGTQADADQGNTLCLVDQELVTYQQATLTSQYHYDLGKHGSTAGYLRRGVYGTAIASHASGAPFVRLRSGSYFTIGYGASDVGSTVHVKLLSFNPWGGGKQTLDEVASHPHTLAAPPAVSTGLLAGLIQTPDIALNAATAQLTVSAAGPISLPVSPANATLVSGTLTTEGNLVQIAYNAQITNNGASAETAIWRLTYQGVTVLDSASITIQPGATATIAKQTSFSAPNQSGVFAMIAQGQAAGDANLVASFVDLSVTEIRR